MNVSPGSNSLPDDGVNVYVILVGVTPAASVSGTVVYPATCDAAAYVINVDKSTTAFMISTSKLSMRKREGERERLKGQGWTVSQCFFLVNHIQRSWKFIMFPLYEL